MAGAHSQAWAAGWLLKMGKLPTKACNNLHAPVCPLTQSLQLDLHLPAYLLLPFKVLMFQLSLNR